MTTWLLYSSETFLNTPKSENTYLQAHPSKMLLQLLLLLVLLHSSTFRGYVKSFDKFWGKFLATTSLLILCKFSCTETSLCFTLVFDVTTMLITCSIINNCTEWKLYTRTQFETHKKDISYVFCTQLLHTVDLSISLSLSLSHTHHETHVWKYTAAVLIWCHFPSQFPWLNVGSLTHIIDSCWK
jgi:hypothetical protein